MRITWTSATTSATGKTALWCRICVQICHWLFCICFWTLLLIFCSSGQSDKSTALHDAAYNGHLAVCQLLIASKADVDAKNRCAFRFWICLWFCFAFYFLTLLLICSSSFQNTALQCAVYRGHSAVCELLIASKADVDTKSRCAFIFEFAADFELYYVFELCM
jgi:uncharacterized protein YggT (Ycf19 family)